MKHQYTKEEIQTAIDAALNDTDTASKSIVTKLHYPNTWKLESKARLHLAEKLLELLPETSPAEIPWIEWHGGECPLNDEEVERWECKLRSGKEAYRGVPSELRWTHIDDDDIIAYRVTKWKEGFGPNVDWKAELAHWKEEAGRYCRNAEFWRSQNAEPSLSTLRPIAEAGEVPSGCVRVSGWLEDDGWYVSPGDCDQDTHFADIRLPESPISTLAQDQVDATPAMQAAADAVLNEVIHEGGEVFQKVEPAPSTFTAHGKTWTRHVPGDPMPCDGGCKIYAWDNLGIKGPFITQNYDWSAERHARLGGNIIGWRYADDSPSGKSTSEATITPPWTPAVGDVVTLKSGGPKMTVSAVGRVEVQVHGFKGESLVRSMLPIATLTKADS